jgi:hypothetical protein
MQEVLLQAARREIQRLREVNQQLLDSHAAGERLACWVHWGGEQEPDPLLPPLLCSGAS